MRPNVTNEKIVLKTPYFEVKKSKLLIGKKKKARYDIFRKPVVLVFPITDNNEVYLINQYRYLHEKVIVEAVAGHIDEGEVALKAAVRELKEEVGLEVDQIEEFAKFEGGGSIVKLTTHFFLAKGLHFGEANPEEDEEIEMFKTPLSEAVMQIMEGKIRNSSTALGILMLDRLRINKKL